eukprot:9738685-Alexandrium_andersonii.AAC.1
MPPVNKRPSSAPARRAKAKAKADVLKKPASAKAAVAMVDWSSWAKKGEGEKGELSLIHISEPTRLALI